MSPLTESIAIGGGIFAVMMLRTYGTRTFDRMAVIMPLVMVGVFGYFYLPDAPRTSHELPVYAVAVGLGILYGVLTATLTTVHRHTGENGTEVATTTGMPYAVAWFSAMAARVVAVWLITDVPTVHDKFGLWMINHSISFDAIAPFFVLWALTMVVVRVALVAGRVQRLSTQPAVALAG